MNDSLRAKLQENGLLQEVESFLKEERQASYQAGVGKSYEEVDRAIEEVFGIRKEGKVLTTEFLKSAVKLHEQGLTMDIEKKFEDVKKKNIEMEEQLKKVPDAKKYEDLRETHNRMLKEKEEEIEKLKAEYETKDKISKISQVFSTLPLEFPDNDYKSFKFQQFTENLKNDGLLDNIVEIDGKIVLKGGEKHGHRDFVLEDRIKESFKQYMKDSGGEPTPKPGEPTPLNTKLSSVKSKGDALALIRNQLIEQGMKVTDEKWDTMYQKALSDNKETLEALE